MNKSVLLETKTKEEYDKMTYTEKLEHALQVCVKALYESIEIAPLDYLPSNNGTAIQEAQYVLDSKKEKNND